MVNLSKGQKVSLDKSLQMCKVGLGWDPSASSPYPYDLDASVFMLQGNNLVRSDDDFVFYGNQCHISNSVMSLGDDRTGQNSDGGDDETIVINFNKIPSYIEKLVVVVTINDAEERRQNFGQISNVYVRVAKITSMSDPGNEVIRYDLNEEFSDETAVIACEIVRNGADWKFKAMGIGSCADLADMCRKYGINV